VSFREDGRDGLEDDDTFTAADATLSTNGSSAAPHGIGCAS
jgi:hypothetical protein